MFKNLSNKLVFAAVITVVSLVACGDSEEKSSVAIAAAGSLLNYVPASWALFLLDCDQGSAMTV